jgi:hypothetical protein
LISTILVATVVVAPSLGGLINQEPAAADDSLPWPYCAPDAAPPAPEDPPQNPADVDSGLYEDTIVGEGRAAFTPHAEAIVVPSAMELLGNPDPSGFQEAELFLEEVVWETMITTVAEEPVPPPRLGAIKVLGERTIWLSIMDLMATGGRVPLALDLVDGGYVARDADYGLMFGLDTTSANPRILSSTPAEDTADFQAFLSWDANPLHDSDPLDLIKAWNIEMDAPDELYPIVGPIGLSFETWWEETSGGSYPTPGTARWWAEAPADCRSTLDAPLAVVRDLDVGEAWISVPPQWRGLTDSTLCLSTEFASMGCADPSVANDSWPYLHWAEALMPTGSEVRVQLALLKDGAVSWTDRIDVGWIPYEHFFGEAADDPASHLPAHAVEILLHNKPDGLPWTSYEEVRDYLADKGPKTGLVTATVLTHEERAALANQIPEATTESTCPSGTDCP